MSNKKWNVGQIFVAFPVTNLQVYFINSEQPGVIVNSFAMTKKFLITKVYCIHTVILPDWTLKKWGHYNFAFKDC